MYEKLTALINTYRPSLHLATLLIESNIELRILPLLHLQFRPAQRYLAMCFGRRYRNFKNSHCSFCLF